MHRRRFLLLASSAVWGLPLLSSCTREPSVGPVRIVWDRDTCEHCKMIISEKRFAAQIRNPAMRVYKFDDFGCAVSFLKNQEWAAQPAEFWVADMSNSGQWLDARQAHYLGGKTTPMGFGFGATTLTGAGIVSYEEARKAVLAFLE
ncbi:MAG: nitrous oxide reductase accessory protein NosL [Betaproteobacteria bacterium]|nr:nitrous oxide reductase accessory protein NosL [Betaproteobacteria bacterium]